MMTNIAATPEEVCQRNRIEADRLSDPWGDYASKFNSLTALIIEAGIDPNLLTDVIDSAITLYRD